MERVCDECSQQLKDDSDLAVHLNSTIENHFVLYARKNLTAQKLYKPM